MNPRQVQHFRRILLGWRAELLSEMERTVSHLKEEAGNFPDPNDRASQEEEFALELRARDRERKLIHKIGEALEILERDEYGYCEGCGVEIGVRRLEARPTATLCVDCKNLDEIRERQRA
ncbi:MAG TPA: RNA polymerase-binding protein DksA [Gammaproteobacteria bacterium]|nr:RNA polymerase-binding protein DksA [Gammaproteobacteria bacterium]